MKVKGLNCVDICFIRGINGGPAGAQAGQDSDDEIPYETKGFDYGKYALVSDSHF